MKKDKWKAFKDDKVYCIDRVDFHGRTSPHFDISHGTCCIDRAFFRRSNGQYPTIKERDTAITRMKKAML